MKDKILQAILDVLSNFSKVNVLDRTPKMLDPINICAKIQRHWSTDRLEEEIDSYSDEVLWEKYEFLKTLWKKELMYHSDFGNIRKELAENLDMYGKSSILKGVKVIIPRPEEIDKRIQEVVVKRKNDRTNIVSQVEKFKNDKEF